MGGGGGWRTIGQDADDPSTLIRAMEFLRVFISSSEQIIQQVSEFDMKNSKTNIGFWSLETCFVLFFPISKKGSKFIFHIGVFFEIIVIYMYTYLVAIRIDGWNVNNFDDMKSDVCHMACASMPTPPSNGEAVKFNNKIDSHSVDPDT
jgi:hypothetical protein